MRNLRRKSAGGPAEGITATRRLASRAFRPLALACLALATTVLTGCQSGPCGGGPCAGGGLWNGVKSGVQSVSDSVRSTTARVFHHKSKGCDTCGGGGYVEGVPVEGQVISGGVIQGQGPVVIPPSNAGESNPTILDPLPPPSGGTSTPKGKTSSSVGPASLKDLGNKQSAVSQGRSIDSYSVGRGENLARAALIPSASPTAEGVVSSSKSTSERSPLDNIPQVDLANDVAKRGQASPVPVEAELVKIHNIEKSPPDDVELPAIKASLQTANSAGIKRFSSVKPKINGGSEPASDGLNWLKEHGIRTLVDLREPNEIDAKSVETAKTLGFRYVSLPVNSTTINTAMLVRFADEINKADGQPVYFFDKDGNRAGLAWYLHRLTVDKVDAQIATREAEDLGLNDKAVWVAASKFIDANKATEAAAKAKLQPKQAVTPTATNKPVAKPAASSSVWRSSATLFMTGLNAPLVVEGASAIVNANQVNSASPTVKAR